MEQKAISSRLLDERHRLGRTQDEFAAIGGVSKRAYCNYENGERESGGVLLAALAKAGVDVQFVLTGVNSANLSVLSDSAGRDKKDGIVTVELTERSSLLLSNYERCSEAMKEAIERTVKAMADRKRIDMALGVAQMGETFFLDARKSKK